MSTVEACQENVRRLEDELREAKEALLVARLAVLPFKVGDVVEAKHRDHGWKPAIIREIEPSGNTWTWWRVSFRKKDGDWSRSVSGVSTDHLRTPAVEDAPG